MYFVLSWEHIDTVYYDRRKKQKINITSMGFF